MKKTPYFVLAAQDFGESVQVYLEHAKCNYVIKHKGEPLTWDDGTPVIFGDLGEVANELGNWTMPIENVSIISEYDYLTTYCKNEVDYYLVSGIMDSHSHDNELVHKINDAWDKNREMFYPILCALYRRDIDEITDADSFRDKEWEETKEYNDGVRSGDWTDYNNMVLGLMCKEWDFYATNYLEHIADDTDLECILNFLHYPYLPIYKN